ncbi:protein abrupt [Toxorhynchites rutilus septentrionalis]|uniref:protein abrupt n=1 Tax=Toxorhynchites rutilus septentrionalis TaxID=329112 RepID=UPI00247B255C|nr:protein abrupt [Toxorhynchites rutilus septentrionalis]
MDEFALCWNNFADNIANGFQNLYERGDLVDVTIACDGKLLKAHKIVLAICSPYFQEMFISNPCKHPIVVLKDVSLNVMQELLQFMYQGEVNVKHSELQSFMKIAETLQIKGLTSSHKTGRSTSPPAQPAPAHSSSNNNQTNRNPLQELAGPSTSHQLDPSKLNSYLAAAAKETLKRTAGAVFQAADQYPIHYPKKVVKRSTDSIIDQDSNSADCMDNLSSDEVFVPASPQISMVEQQSSSARQFDLASVKRENINDSSSSPQQQSPTNLATSGASTASCSSAAAVAAGMRMGFSSTPTHHHPALHPMFAALDNNSNSFSGITSSFAASMGASAASNGGPGGNGNSVKASDVYPNDYTQNLGPGHMDIPAVAPGEKWFQGRLQFMLSQRGKPLLVHDGHSFGIQYIRKDKKYWQCNLSRKYNCKARVTTTDTGDIIVTNNEHCHTEIRQHLRKDYKSMKQLNASLAALRAQQQEAVSLGLTTSESVLRGGGNNNSLCINNNNNGSVISPILVPSQLQPQEQETSLNLSTSSWQLKKEPINSNE